MAQEVAGHDADIRISAISLNLKDYGLEPGGVACLLFLDHASGEVIRTVLSAHPASEQASISVQTEQGLRLKLVIDGPIRLCHDGSFHNDTYIEGYLIEAAVDDVPQRMRMILSVSNSGLGKLARIHVQYILTDHDSDPDGVIRVTTDWQRFR